jgi:hypothetical protein
MIFDFGDRHFSMLIFIDLCQQILCDDVGREDLSFSIHEFDLISARVE